MIIINFTHPLTHCQQEQIASLVERPFTILDIPCQLNNQNPFADQIRAILDTAKLTPTQWQSDPILINPPAYAPASVAMLAELHGRMGYFPAIIRIRPIVNNTPPQFEIAEFINLQAIRDTARESRKKTEDIIIIDNNKYPAHPILPMYRVEVEN